MYTDRTVAQATRAINDRLHVAGTKSRPQLDGWIEKNGRFGMSVTTRVYGRFKRRTLLQGIAERDGGGTIVRGTVPGGLSREKQRIVIGIMVAVGILALASGNAILALVAVAAGAALTIPLQGDFDNAEYLLTELQRTLKARLTPPKT